MKKQLDHRAIITYCCSLWVLLLLFSVSLAGQTTATFTKVYNILQTNCASASCHGATSPNPLKFSGTEQDVYDHLVNVLPTNAAAQQRGDKLVKPGYPDNSFLVRKMNHGLYSQAGLLANEGNSMPPVSAISAKDRELVRQWILYGAPMTEAIDNESAIEEFYNGGGLPRIESLAPPAPGQGFQIYLGTLFIEPGQEYEIIKKQEIPLGDSLEIVGIECSMNPFSHHYGVSIFRNPDFASDAPEGIRPITNLGDALDFFYNSSYVAGAQSAHNETFLPAGTAFRWDIGTTLNLNYHIYNYSNTGVLPAEAYINFYTQPRGIAAHHMETATIMQANPFSLFLQPNGQDTTFTMSHFENNSNKIMNVWLLNSHTHSRGKDFDMYLRNPDGTRGEQIYEGFFNGDYSFNQGYFDYSHPPVRHFEPLLSVPFKDGFVMDGTFNNPGPNPITFGMSVNNEMFIAYMLYTLDSINTSIATPAFPQNPDLQIAPNPSNGLFNIAYNNYESGKVNILVTNMLGETVAQLLNNDMPKGRINTLFDATQLPSGVYLVNVYTSSGIATKRIVKVE